MAKSYYSRKTYLAQVKPYIDKPLIKVILGQRRSGKSYFLIQLMDFLITSRKVPKQNILYINREDLEFDDLRTYKDLDEYIKKSFQKIKGKKYLFIDEIQEIEDFHKALRSYAAKDDFDIYCTGSNAHMLSSDIANTLGGRYISFEVFPLSYVEFLDFHKLADSKDSLDQYFAIGGMPYLIHIEDQRDLYYQYLRNIYDTVLLKDVVARHGLRHIDFLNRFVMYLASNLGSIVSAKSISDYLKSQKVKLSTPIVINYLNFLEQAFFIHRLKRYDLVGKKIFQINEKIYFNDLGIRHAMVGYSPAVDIEKILENQVYLHLKRLGYKVFVGYIQNKEIDFVAQKGEETMYIQVAYSLDSAKVIDREFGNLLLVRDNFRKMVVTMRDFKKHSYKGIEHMYIGDFLQLESLCA